MMAAIKRTLIKQWYHEKVWLGLFLVVSIIIKSYNLLGLPLYLDEGIYLSWAKLFSHDASLAYVSMQDGKTPLFIWLLAWLNPILNNSLLTGRLISVISGMASLGCWTIIAKRYFGTREAIGVGILSLLTPYSLLVERMAFVDSLMVAFGSISLLGCSFIFSLQIDKKKWWQWLFFSIVSGLALGLAFMTKTSAKALLASEFFIVACCTLGMISKKHYRLALLFALSFGVTYLFYHEIVGYLRFGGYRFWEMITVKEGDLTFPINQILRRIFIERDISIYLKNLPVVLNYFLFYLSGLLLPLAVGVVYIVRKRKDNLWILFYTMVLFWGIFLSAKVVASRYFYPLVWPMILVSAVGAGRMLKYRWGRIVLVPLGCLLALQVLSMILWPLNFRYAPDDQAYLVRDSFSALGLPETIEQLHKETAPVNVAVIGIWGVADGSTVLLGEAGINAHKIGNFGDVSSGEYLYLTDSQNFPLISLSEKSKYRVVRVFVRPGSQYKVYLLKIE